MVEVNCPECDITHTVATCTITPEVLWTHYTAWRYEQFDKANYDHTLRDAQGLWRWLTEWVAGDSDGPTHDSFVGRFFREQGFEQG